MKADDLSQLPGADLFETGLKDLAAGTQSTSAFLVAIGAPRLRRLGVTLPPPEQMPSRPEHGLYRLLAHSSVAARIRGTTLSSVAWSASSEHWSFNAAGSAGD